MNVDVEHGDLKRITFSLENYFGKQSEVAILLRAAAKWAADNHLSILDAKGIKFSLADEFGIVYLDIFYSGDFMQKEKQ